MAEPTTPGEARKHTLRRTRWIVGGTAVGAAAFLTGIVAGVNGGDNSTAGAATTDRVSSSVDRGAPNVSPIGDRYRPYGDDDDFDRYDDARSYSPRQPSWQPQSPSQFSPQTRSGGS